MENYEVTISDIIEHYEAHAENGATAIKLEYNDEKEDLIVAIRCTDDAYPYWSHSENMHCTLKNFAIILAYIVEGRLCDERTGEKYVTLIDWEWYS